MGSNFGRLYYSVVDMSLNGGLGDVVFWQKGILLDSNLTEKMTAIVGDRCNVWLLVHEQSSNTFKAWEITSGGISTSPVISNCGNFSDYSMGELTVAPNRKKLVACISSVQMGRMELYDFNPAIGVVSNAMILDNISYYGAAFSSNSLKLYASTSNSYNYRSEIYQFDLTAVNPASSKTFIGPDIGEQLKLAPDGKIYFKHVGGLGNTLGTINFPNLAGTACGYTAQAVYLLNNTSISLGLPTAVPVISPPKDTLTATRDTILCRAQKGDYIPIRLSASPGTYGYIWNDGNTDSTLNVDTPGRYWVFTKSGECAIPHVDTFVVRPGPDLSISLGSDTVICNADSYKLDATVPARGAAYFWQDSSTDPVYTVSRSGAYFVQVSKDGCISSASVRIQLSSVVPDLGEDTTVCKEDFINLSLTAHAAPQAHIAWSTGANSQSISIPDSGTYWVTVTDPPCIGRDTIHISSEQCGCFVETPNAFTPNGDGLNDLFMPVIEAGCFVKGYQFSVYDRYGTRIFMSVDPGKGWDGTYNGRPATPGTYFWEVHFNGGQDYMRSVYYRKGDVTLIR